jgi:S-DNA-T family DNA segregation ATPase FtsK/SpoIIIE
MPENKMPQNKKLKAKRPPKELPPGPGERGNSRRTGEPIKEAVPASPPSAGFVHQLIPYLLLVLTLFIAACFVCVAAGVSGAVGVAGSILNDVFCGLFGWPAYFLPLVLLNLAVFWRQYVDMKLVGLKLSLSLLILLVTSALVHVVTINNAGRVGFNVIRLWGDGINLIGGGVLGGILGELCFSALGIIGSLIILNPLIAVLFMFLFGTTPRGIRLYIARLLRERAERLRLMAEAEADESEAEGDENADEPAVGTDKKRRRAARERKKAKKEEQKRRRHEVLGNIDAAAPVDAVFTEGHKTIIGDTTSKVLKSDAADKTVQAAGGEGGILPPEPEVKEKVAGAEPKSDIPEPVRSGGVSALTEQLEQDEDYNDLGELLHGKSDIAGKDVLKKEDSDKKEADIELNVSTEDISDLAFDEEEEPLSTGKQLTTYIFPPVDLLAPDTNPKEADYSEELRANAKKLMDTLSSFNVRIKEITYSRGPTITRYELKPDAGVRVRSIANLVDDIALSLATTGVRIEAPIPGKAAVGVEVPNRTQAIVFLRTLIESKTFQETPSKLAVCLGEDVAGKPIFFNIDKMPHLLIAGATGMGKSVCINSIIISILYKARPDEVKLILVDPKKVEFNVYKDMPHLYVPVVSDPKKAAGVLATAVAEMERRFEMIEDLNVRDITNYNRIAENDPELMPMPRIVIIIDELADLMMTAPNDVETCICRLAQKARAAGIHLIIGTQRPSVDVITGLIKANIPSRIAFTVASQIDSRTIIDMAGAEKLIGRGDMLFSPVGAAKPIRVQGAYVSELEVENIVDYIKTHNSGAQYDHEFLKRVEEEAAKCGNKKGGKPVDVEELSGEEFDPKLRDAIELAIETGKISTSLMQRRLEVGYGRAAKIIDQMEKLGYVGPQDGNKPRRVLITKEQFMEKLINDDL